MTQQKLKLSIEIGKGCDLSMTLEDAIKSFLNDKTEEENEEKQEMKYYCNNPKCKKEITKANVAYCLNNKEIFGGKVFCEDCQNNLKRKGNDERT